MYNKPRHFRCDCGWAQHSLYVDPDIEDGDAIITMQVVNGENLTLWDRVKTAFAILFGRGEHVMSEVVLHRDDLRDFVSYFNLLLYERDSCEIFTDSTRMLP